MRAFKKLWFPHPSQSRGHRRGQSLVELALTLPLLFLILFGVVDLGRLFTAYVTITNASREGARYGMTNSTDSSGIVQAAANEAGGLISASNVLVKCASASSPQNYGSCASPQPGDRMKVTVSYNFQFATLYLFGLSNITISDYTIMVIVK